MSRRRCRCGYVFPGFLGAYGCPNCCGDSGVARTIARPRICELPDKLVRNRGPRSFARIYDRASGATTWTLVFIVGEDRAAPLYRWTRMEPGASRDDAAAAIRRMRDYLVAKTQPRTVH